MEAPTTITSRFPPSNRGGRVAIGAPPGPGIEPLSGILQGSPATGITACQRSSAEVTPAVRTAQPQKAPSSQVQRRTLPEPLRRRLVQGEFMAVIARRN